MPNKIDTDSIIRDRENEKKDQVLKSSNADYVTNLEETSSLMPPEKPFETERAQESTKIKEESDISQSNDFVQHSKTSTNEIVRLDKTNETKLYLLNLEHEKIANKLGDGSISKKEQANLESLIQDVEDKIELYRSKLKAGAMGGNAVLEGEVTGEGDGEEGGGIGDTVLGGLKDQILMGAPGIIAGAKDDEEEEEEKENENEKEFDQ